MATQAFDDARAAGPSGELPDLVNAEAFLHKLEGFVLGHFTLGAVLGWSDEQIDGFVALGDRLLAAGRSEEALILFEGALALDPRRVPLHCRLALCYLADGAPERSAACLAAARQQFGNLPELDDFELELSQNR